MVAYSPATVASAAAGLVTSSFLNTNYKGGIDDLRTKVSPTSANIATFTGSGVAAGSTQPKASRMGDLVVLSGLITDTNSVLAAGAIATLPSGYWPVSSGSWPVTGDGTTWARLSISTVGVVTFQAMGGTTPTTVDLSPITFIGS